MSRISARPTFSCLLGVLLGFFNRRRGHHVKISGVMIMGKIVNIVRGLSTDEGTFSSFRFNGQAIYCTELPWHDNAPRISCIPVGTYTCKLRWSPKHNANVYGVENVPGRSDIEIHSANFSGDEAKGWQAELLGCIAPCLDFGLLQNKYSKQQRAGLSSKAATQRFMDWAAGDPLTLVISNAG